MTTPATRCPLGDRIQLEISAEVKAPSAVNTSENPPMNSRIGTKGWSSCPSAPEMNDR